MSASSGHSVNSCGRIAVAQKVPTEYTAVVFLGALRAPSGVLSCRAREHAADFRHTHLDMQMLRKIEDMHT